MLKFINALVGFTLAFVIIVNKTLLFIPASVSSLHGFVYSKTEMFFLFLARNFRSLHAGKASPEVRQCLLS